MQQIELGSANNEREVSGFVTDPVDEFSSSTEFRAADVQRTSSKWNKFAPLVFIAAIILTFVVKNTDSCSLFRWFRKLSFICLFQKISTISNSFHINYTLQC